MEEILHGTATKHPRWNKTGKTPRILLCGVFGPYGVDD